MENSTHTGCCNLNSTSKSSVELESAVADFAASMETPDLRNWFSSYVYQSPELTQSFSCEDSFPMKGESTKDIGLYVEDSEGEEVNAGIDPAGVKSNYPSMFVRNISGDGCSLHESLDELDQQHKVPENTDSLPSQPPDIRNWFSSYVYESPTLDSAEIGCSLPASIDSVGAEDDFIQKDTAWTSVDLIADKSRQTDVKRRKLVGSSQLESVSEDHRNDTPSEAKKLPIPGKNSCCQEALVDENCVTNPADVLKYNGNMERIKREENERAGSEKDPGWVLPNSRSKEGSSRRKMSANANKKKNESAENGVVEKGLMTSRKPLMEISNVCSSGSNEVAGKWWCPQKTKPFIGPPLKQLRLEKWIHRV